MRVNRDRPNAKLISAAKDSNRNLATIRHQKFFNRVHISLRRSRSSTGFQKRPDRLQTCLTERGSVRYGTVPAVAIPPLVSPRLCVSAFFDENAETQMNSIQGSLM